MRQNRSCFVISPIGPAGSPVRHHADDVYRFIIKPALELEEFEISAERSDEISETGRITDQMFERIFRADLCVVLLTGFNPNVFYELAVAQCAARPTLLLIEKGQELPFDVKDLRTVEYQLQPVSRLVDGDYVKEVQEQVRQLAASDWTVSGLFEQSRFAPRLHTEQQVRRLLLGARPKTLPTTVDSSFALPFDPQDPERRVTILTGDIIELAETKKLEELHVDTIVSLENTYLQLDSYFTFSMSGKLRYLAAEKTVDGKLRDSLGRELEKQISELGINPPVAPGTVIPTFTHQLVNHGVKAVFHVAGPQGTPGDGYVLSDEAIDDCVSGVFDAFKVHTDQMQLKSILLPMLGSFMTHLDQTEVVRRILRTVRIKMKDLAECRQVFLLAWIESQRTALRQVAKELGLEEIHATGGGKSATAAERVEGAQ